MPANESDEVTVVDVVNIAMPAFEIEQNDVIEWLNCDNNDPGFQLLTDDEIISDVNEAENDDDSIETDTEYDGSGKIKIGNKSQTNIINKLFFKRMNCFFFCWNEE